MPEKETLPGLPLPSFRLALMGVPYDGSSSYLRGAARGPAAIRSAFASESSNLWSETGRDLGEPGALTDAGDVAGLEESSPEDAASRIERAVASLLDAGAAPICLGGDHSITYPIVRAFAKRFPRLSLIHFDAHPDLYDEFGGSRLSHACPFARILEEGCAQRLVQVGIRAATRHQRDQAKRFGVEMREMRGRQDARPIRFDSPVYVSFDLDALDPAHAPGVSHPEAGGLSTRDALDILAEIESPVVGADIVELNPSRDVANLTALAAAKLLKELAAKILDSGTGVAGVTSRRARASRGARRPSGAGSPSDRRRRGTPASRRRAR